MRILLAEDDSMLGKAVKAGLEQDGFAVDWVTDGTAADEHVREQRYDAVVLDLGLGGVSGESLVRDWRARDERTPVVVMTARDAVQERVRLLTLGADDYMVKPIDLLELCARIRAVHRRSEQPGSFVLEFGPLKLFVESQTAAWHGKHVDVSSKEFRLLEALVRNRGRVLSRRQLEGSLYGIAEEVDSNAVEVHVHHLRRKLSSQLIQTVRGVGYTLAQDPEAL